MIAFHTQLLAGSRNVVRVSVGEPEDIKPAGYANCAKLHEFIRLVHSFSFYKKVLYKKARLRKAQK